MSTHSDRCHLSRKYSSCETELQFYHDSLTETRNRKAQLSERERGERDVDVASMVKHPGRRNVNLCGCVELSLW
jgi:hypothetical protein